MDYEYYEIYFNKKTEGRYDITPLFENPELFSNLINDLLEPFKSISFDKVVGLEALGFVIGVAMAQKRGTGFVCIRKSGKLPGIDSTILRSNCFVDYSGLSKSFEINKSSIKKGDKVLLVDDWIETGTQMKEAISLIEQLGGQVVGISTICAHKSQQTKVLFNNYNLRAIKVIDKD